MNIRYKGKKLRLKKHIRQKLFKLTAIASTAALLATNINLIGITHTHADEYRMVTAFGSMDDSVRHQTFYVGEEASLVLPESIEATVDHIEGRYKDIELVSPTASASTLPSASTSPSASASASESASTSPSATASESPTETPSVSPSESPTETASAIPSDSPGKELSESPLAVQSESPIATSSVSPSTSPTNKPSGSPTATPSATPSAIPSETPSKEPSEIASPSPSEGAEEEDDETESENPSGKPSETPSEEPTENKESSETASPSMAEDEQSEETEHSVEDANDEPSESPEYAKLSGFENYIENIRSMFSPIKVYAADSDEHEYKDIDLGLSDDTSEENAGSKDEADSDGDDSSNVNDENARDGQDDKARRIISTTEESIALTWNIDASRSTATRFSTEIEGKYIFVASIDNEYVIDDGVKLPEIEVMVVAPTEAPLDFSVEIDGVKVSVKAPEGVFPAGSRVEVKPIEDHSRLNVIEYVVEQKLNAEDALSDASSEDFSERRGEEVVEREVEEILLFDINVFDKNGNKIQPDNTKGEVKVSFENIPINMEDVTSDDNAICMFRVDDSSEDVDLLETVVSENSVEAVAEHFSEYGMAKASKAAPAGASMTFTELGSADDLVSKILGTGVTASNCAKTGTVYAFSGGSAIGMESGIVLDTSGKYSAANNEHLVKLINNEGQECGGHTSTLEFKLKATGSVLRFNYVFASGEFNQAPQFNDIFGLFISVNGGPYENVALINGGKNVTIQNLKAAGSAYYSGTALNLGLSGHQEATNGVSKVFSVEKPVPLGADVSVLFAIADVSDTGVDSWVMIEAGSLSFDAPESEPDYSTERLANLKPGKTYIIKSTKYDNDGNVISEDTYTLVADEQGTIKLEGTDKDGKVYNFIGTTLTIIQKGEGDMGDSDPQILPIGGRPDTPTDPNAPPNAPTEVDYDDVETTATSMKVKGLYYQEYTIDYNPADEESATWFRPDDTGYVYFTGLTPGGDYHIRTRVSATDSSPCSYTSEGITVKAIGMFTYKKHNYSGEYDGQEHYGSVTTTIPGATIKYCEVSKYEASKNLDNFTTDEVAFKNAGEYHVYFMIEGEGYYTAYGSVVVNINKRALTLKADDKTIAKGDAPPLLTYTISRGSVVDGESLEGISLSREPGDNDNGGYHAITIEANPTKNTNYEIDCIDGKLYINTSIEEKLVPNEGAPETSWSGLPEEDAKSMLELRDVAKLGVKDLTVFLEVTNLDPESGVNSEDRSLTESLIEDKQGEYKTGMYLDLSMFKQFDGEDAEKMTNAVTPNEITIKIELPEELIAPSNVIREYSVVRIHDGEAEELPCVYDNQDQTLSFNTNKFSTYSIWYKDTLIAVPEAPAPKKEAEVPAPIETIAEAPEGYVEAYYDEPSAQEPIAPQIVKPKEPVLNPLPPIVPKINDITKSPQTGDSSNMLLWIMELIVVVGTLAGIKIYAEKKELC